MAKGITKERIIKEAENLIAEKGVSDFSLHTLAERLGIRTASLYSHVSGMEEVLTSASLEILQEFADGQMESIKGKNHREALIALALFERDYAGNHQAYYALIMNLQLSDNKQLKDAASCIVEPVMHVLDDYHLTDNQKTDAERMLRACIYGFISQEEHGYFTHFNKDTDSSFDFAINAIASEIEACSDEK